MIASYEEHDTIGFSQSLGSILRSILDFDSYTSLSGSQNETPSTESFLGFTKIKSKRAPLWEREAIFNEKLARIEEKIHQDAKQYNLSSESTKKYRMTRE